MGTQAQMPSGLIAQPPWQALTKTLDRLHPVVMICAASEILWINRAGAACLGHADPAGLCGRSFFEFLHKDYAELADFGLAVFAEEEGAISIKLVHADQHDIDAQMWVSPLEDGLYMVECHDMSEHLRAARALRQREQRLEGIINTVADGIITLDERGVIQTFNPAAEHIFGFSKEEVLGKTLRALMPDSLVDDGRPAKDWVQLLSQMAHLTGKKKGGEEFPMEMSVRELQQGEYLSFTGIVRDISARRAEEERIFYMAHHDALTGLPNRHLLDDRIEEAFKRSRRHHYKMALLFVDLDKFKPINDRFGHAVGDDVLKEVARRMGQVVRATDTVARVGGDEFMVLLEELTTVAEAEDVAGKIKAAVSAPMALFGHEMAVGASIGIGVYPDHAKDMCELMNFADQAMYRTKNQTRV
ncbi:putative diguanylate cyclase YegE [mine drainage metagenome]|uniref:Putative diguanylate cyclase YegE n=1 Tax=mine drainage metagenome TaxID=410659 RepID=A0A1J5SVA1_9ZZZZ